MTPEEKATADRLEQLAKHLRAAEWKHEPALLDQAASELRAAGKLREAAEGWRHAKRQYDEAEAQNDEAGMSYFANLYRDGAAKIDAALNEPPQHETSFGKISEECRSDIEKIQSENVRRAAKLGDVVFSALRPRTSEKEGE